MVLTRFMIARRELPVAAGPGRNVATLIGGMDRAKWGQFVPSCSARRESTAADEIEPTSARSRGNSESRAFKPEKEVTRILLLPSYWNFGHEMRHYHISSHLDHFSNN